MCDPPKASPFTPELLLPTNPVPEVMAAAGLQAVTTPHTVQRDLLNRLILPTWDNRPNGLEFMTFRDGDNPSLGGNYPGGTIRVPRGAIYHCTTNGKGPPPAHHPLARHRAHPHERRGGALLHGTGDYTYQWQPNFIGSYFYHCHRNTVQHFEFGLFGLTIIEPPDAYFATQNFGVPIGRGNPEPGFPNGRRRDAANISQFPQFSGVQLQPPDFGDPHGFTVPYDVEAIWVLSARDSRWNDLAADARTTFPAHGTIPGVNDRFQENVGLNGFFAFNDYNADYWFVTGLPVPAPRGGESEHRLQCDHPCGREQRRFREPGLRQRPGEPDHPPALPQCLL